MSFKDCDVVIDFTAPAATEQHLKLCREAGVAMVIGTTGMNDEQKAFLDETANTNTSRVCRELFSGCNVSGKLLELAAKCLVIPLILKSLGTSPS